MKNKSIIRDVFWLICGFILFMIGIALVRFQIKWDGMLSVISYASFGVGIVLIGNYLGMIFTKIAIKATSVESKRLNTELNDERNITINDKAKARTFDIMFFAYTAMVLAFSIMAVERTVLFTVVAIYLAMVLIKVFFRLKYDKEM